MQIVVPEGALCVVRALWCFICDVKESCKSCHLCHHSLRALSLFDLSLSPSPLPLQAQPQCTILVGYQKVMGQVSRALVR